MIRRRFWNPREAKYYALHTFPKRGPVSSPFVYNVEEFCEEFGVEYDYQHVGVKTWFTILFDQRGIGFPLFTFQEDVDKLYQPICSDCEAAGWGKHLLSQKRYHFIIPIFEKWDKHIDADVLKCQSHLLHGLIHSNGYGHLLSLNGLEGGSEHFSGTEFMHLWDRICISLHARSISLLDISKKRDMDLRLLLSTSAGNNWFTTFGYHINYPDDIIETKFSESIKKIQNIKLNSKEMRKSGVVNSVVDKYRGTREFLGQLFSDMLKVLHDLRKSGTGPGSNSGNLPLCMHVSKKAKKEIPEKYQVNAMEIAGDMVRYMKNADEIASSVLDHDEVLKEYNRIYTDLKEIYDYVLTIDAVEKEVQTVLKCKLLIKDYQFKDYNVGDAVSYMCEYRELFPDSEIGPLLTHVVLPHNRKAGELKSLIQSTWRKIYYITRDIEVNYLQDYQDNDDAIYPLDGLQTDRIVVVGPGVMDTPYPFDLKFEGARVGCDMCEPDASGGNSLVKCFRCKRMGHRSCYGFGDDDNIPLFLCVACRPE